MGYMGYIGVISLLRTQYTGLLKMGEGPNDPKKGPPTLESIR